MTLPLSVRFFRLIQKLTGSDYSGPDNLTQPLVPDKTALSTKYTAIPTTNGLPNGRLRERNLGVRLELRKRLMRRRRWLVNLEFAMAVTGILLMIVENELYYANPEEKTTPVSFVLKLFISITTIILLIAICLYYEAGIALRMFDGRVDDPFAVTPLSTWLSLAAELIICSIHPFPGNITATFLVVSGDSAVGSIDGVLSVLMMMRLYLVGKFIVVHSSLLTGQSTQTISAVSHVKININFVLRAALNNYPAYFITLLILSMYMWSVWSMRTCELYYTLLPEVQSFPEAMWLSAITFLTVGYGDLTPKTICGRFIAVATALMGLCSTALLVAVIARRLEQTRSERYVYNFLTRVHERNKFRAAAADVAKYTIKICMNRRAGRVPVTGMERTVMHWKLRSAIRTMRAARATLAEIEEATVGLPEVCTLISQLERRHQATQETQNKILEQLESLQNQVAELSKSVKVQT